MQIPAGPIVFALGGNAITLPNEEGNIHQQFAHTRQTADGLAAWLTPGRPVVITHGNGPQVGNVLRRVELAAREVYRIPLEICVADTQAGMGYMIAQCLMNALHARGDSRSVAALVTTVEVDPLDASLYEPDKPIGPVYPPERAERLRAESGWTLVELPGRGFRRVVASPAPQAIVEIDLIRRLVAQGEVLVAAGGGGIPVMRDARGEFMGVSAVIDKDRTSALLARELDAAALIIVTSVPHVCLDFGLPTQRAVSQLSLSAARALLDERHFEAGSMAPKIEAAVTFLSETSRPDARVLICDAPSLATAAAGNSGTWIVK